ncbi:hypothetical protein [Myroides odoratimimus]|uniref:Transcription regulator BetR N-terminal domain-containing protein n=1 Tax=Myroides odoratimimus CIP 101113 TaxID=883154 RepID=A0AAV3F3J2_9FLAO|nr:hypothetical protein [Myroides odoratimimus]EHO12642.1 hypothetical protein HMPREF9715_01797 [Myroides odoratimimus CIP 101113]SHL27462.1 hypothetical protein SAMN05444275_103150 [Myroides odoratimimus subsp. xuanwuensis]
MSAYQKHFIHIISEQLPEGVKLVDFISELIHLGKEACYRRIRGEVEFTLTEVVTIAKAMNINLTSLIIREGGDKITCNLRVLKEDTLEQVYIRMIEAELNVLEGFEQKSRHTLHMVCKELPELLYLASDNLMKLRLMKIELNQGVLIPTAFKKIEITSAIKRIQQRYWQALQDFKLTVYLGPDILNTLVYDILYFYKINTLTEEDKTLIQSELNDVIDLLSLIGSTGKYKDKEIELYLSYLGLDISHNYLKSDGLEASVVHLSSPNSILSFDPAFNNAQEHRINMIKRTSTLISLSGEPEKVAYLNKQREVLKNIKSK